MKKITYSLLVLVLVGFVLSCTDDSLDPLQTEKVKKGTLLALRGTQLDNIYFIGLPGAEFYPGSITGDETFDFDAEYLAEDPNTLESFDMFVIKISHTPGGDEVRERVLLKKVPFSDFKKTDDYMRPWVSVSIPITDIFEAIGITDYDDPDAIETLLTDYQPGIDIESDLNLTDGSVIPASEIRASGLFDSDQFYPAQKLTYNSVEFCPYQAASWTQTYQTFNVFPNGTVSDFYTVTLAQTGANTFTIANFGGTGGTATVEFEPATLTVYEQNIELKQVTFNGTALVGAGTYNQCDKSFSLDAWKVGDATKKVTVSFQFAGN